MLEWYFEDGAGNKRDIESQNKYSDNKGNKMFVSFMDLLYEAVTLHNVSVETIWNMAKRYRLDFLRGTTKCSLTSGLVYTVGNQWTDYIDNIALDLNITSFIYHEEPKYKAEINDSFLSDGFQIFHYVTRCTDMDRELDLSYKWSFYDRTGRDMDTFNNDSPLTLLEAGIKLSNIAVRQLTGEDVKYLNGGKKLMEKMHNIYGLDIYKLDILSSTLSDLKTRVATITDKNLRRELSSCLDENNCDHLEQLLMTLGKASDLIYLRILYFQNYSDDLHIKAISNHPPHILMKNETMFSPSSFIPFCSLAGNMSVVGATTDRFSAPVCNIFKEVVLEGQLCYQADVNSLRGKVDRNEMVTEGFTFMLDYNKARMVDSGRDAFSTSKELGLLTHAKSSEATEEALIYVETLGK